MLPQLENSFIYLNMQFTNRSLFKLASQSTNEDTKILKYLTGDKEFMAEITRRVRHAIN